MAKTNIRWAINRALSEEMARDEKVFVIGEDVGYAGGPFGATRGLLDKYGEMRVKDTPISEEVVSGAAVGAAMVGYRPVCEIMFMDFITIAMDQICNQAAKTYFATGGRVKVPMVIRTLGGGGFRAGCHHSQSLESWFTNVPGLKVVFPATPYDTIGLLKSAIRDDNPVVFIEHKSLLGLKGEVPEEEFTVPIGKADIKKEGTDVTIITYGRMVQLSLEAAADLEKEGISAEVVDLRTLLPLDKDTILESVRKTHRACMVYEGIKIGGFGGEVSATIAEEAMYELDAPLKRFATDFSVIPVGDTEDFLYPTKEEIVQGIKEMM